jgi:hypothetical protein
MTARLLMFFMVRFPVVLLIARTGFPARLEDG